MLKVAVIGTGNISTRHISAYLTFPERCKIVALCDIYPEKAEAKKEQYGLTGAAVYASHKDMLGKVDVDLVDVCTPPYVHAEIAIDALSRGQTRARAKSRWPPPLRSATRMLAANARAARRFSVIAQNRLPIACMAPESRAGQRTAGESRRMRRWIPSGGADTATTTCGGGYWEKEGGGCTLNHAVHHIDMLGWMMGLPDELRRCSPTSRMITLKSKTSPSPPCGTRAVRWRR